MECAAHNKVDYGKNSRNIWLFSSLFVIYSEISGIFVTVYNAIYPTKQRIYVELTQERINLFADATLDHQWIHVDTERAKTESPFKSTIAHGYLTLSMLPHLWNQIIEVNNLKMMINYGMDKMKFGQAVLSGQSIRLVASLHSLANLRGVAKAEIKFAIEIEGEKKKALEGIAIFLYYFN